MPDSLSYIRAKGFRRQMTPPEARLWNCVRAGRLRGPATASDRSVHSRLLCAEAKLAIEVDGAVHEHAKQIAHDRRRTVWLGEQGIRVIRLRASDIRDELDGVLNFILTVVRERRGDR